MEIFFVGSVAAIVVFILSMLYAYRYHNHVLSLGDQFMLILAIGAILLGVSWIGNHFGGKTTTYMNNFLSSELVCGLMFISAGIKGIKDIITSPKR